MVPVYCHFLFLMSQNEVAKLEEVRLVHLAKMQEKMSQLFPDKQTRENLDGGGDGGSEEEADEHDLIALGGSDEDAEAEESSKVAAPVPSDLSSDPPSLL